MEKNRISLIKIIYSVLVLAVFAAAFVFMSFSSIKDGWVGSLFSDEQHREEMINENLPLQKAALFPYQFTNSLLERKYYPDGSYFIRTNGTIVQGSDTLSSLDVAGHVKQLYNVCREENRNFLYVLCPGKPETDEELRQYGVSCYRNESADLLIQKLNDTGVPVLDLRPLIWNAGRAEGDPYSMFYKSDHHWTADAGRIAAEETAAELNRLYGLGLHDEAICKDRMLREVMDEPFVGEMGQKLLGKFGCNDHLVIWRPAAPAELHYCSPQQGIDRTGDFDIIFHEEKLITGETTYYYYMGGNDQLGYLENKNGGENSILIIKDTYSCVVMPYLALTAGRVTWWDMREDKAVLNYIREHPEIKTVIIMYSMSMASRNELNDYQ